MKVCRMGKHIKTDAGGCIYVRTNSTTLLHHFSGCLNRTWQWARLGRTGLRVKLLDWYTVGQITDYR